MPIATAVVTPPSSGGWLVSPDGRELPLRAATLRAAAGGGLARSVLEQQFTNPYDEPLRLRYALPLPVDGAVAGFSFRIGDRTVVGEIRSREEARERYEEALVAGRTGALVEQERPNLFTQELGNVPPHTDVTVEITVDQPLAWLPQGGWEYRFPTVAAPRYLGGPGRVDDAARVTLAVAAGDLPARLKLAFTVRGEALADPMAESPSHAIRVEAQEDGFAVSLAAASGVALDRDVVLRWAAAGREPGVRLEVARPPAGHTMADSAFGLLTIVPPAPDVPRPLVARDLIVLLDVSGSMLGEPLDQAVALVEAMVDGLGEADRLEMIAFAMRAERWRSAPARMERATRAAALAWLRNLSADGGTEMVEGLREALAPLRPDAQRQVVLVTDGLIGFEDEAVREVIDHLPAGSRVHVVGVGPAVNRGLTQPLARAGRGAELVVGIDEPIAVAAGRLVALTSAPLAVDLEVRGPAVRGTAPRRLPDVMAGTPCMAAVALDPAGGDLVVRGRLGNEVWERHVEVSAVECGVGSSAVLARWAREAVADAEMRFAGGFREEDEAIERLGLDFGIATRRTSWVAISDEVTVDPTQPTRRVEMPQMLPVGLSAFGLGLTEELGEAFGDVMTLAMEEGATRGFRQTPRWFRLGLGRAPRRLGSGQGFVLRQQIGTSGRSPRWVAGRIVLATPSRLVVEFDVGATALSWLPDAEVMLDLQAPHGVLQARMMTESTAPGRIEPGRTVRLVLQLDHAPPAPIESIMIVLAGGPPLIVAIEGA